MQFCLTKDAWSRKSRYVALKVMTAKSSASAGTELSIYTRLGETAPGDPLSEHVVMLLDSFEHVGPNGTHRCLVFKPMGASTASMVHELPSNKPRMRGKQSRYPKLMAKEILKDALSGQAFLHKNGVTHGDLHPGNLLFSIRQLESISEEELQHDKTNLTEPLRRLDEKMDKWAPRYLALGHSLHGYADLGVDMAVKISDLGAGTHPPLPSPFEFLQV